MHAVFSQAEFVVKRRKIPLTSKHRVYGPEETEPWLFFEEKTKWLPPSSTTHVYADDTKMHEVLTLKNSNAEGIDVDIIDATSGQKIGGISTSAGTLGEVFRDAWAITDAENKPIGKLFEKSAARSVVRGVLGSELPQKLEVTVGDILVGELRQKAMAIGYQLSADFSMDATGLLDRRLGLAAAIFAALHQGKVG